MSYAASGTHPAVRTGRSADRAWFQRRHHLRPAPPCL